MRASSGWSTSSAAWSPPLLTPPVEAHLSSLSRLKLRLALDGRLDDLRRVIAWQRDSTQEFIVPDGHSFRFDLPADLAARIDDEVLHDVKVTRIVTLEDLEIDGTTLHLVASARVSRSVVAPDEVALRVRHRGKDDWHDIPATDVREVGRGGTPALEFRAALDAARYPEGIQDLFVVHRYGGLEFVNRLGRNRSERIEERSHRLLDPVGQRDVGLAYFTKDYGNLSFDVGYTLHDRRGPDAHVLTVLRSGPGVDIALVACERPEDLKAVVHSRQDAPETGEEVRVVPAGKGVGAVVLPPKTAETEPLLSVSDLSGRATLSIPPAVDLSTEVKATPLVAGALAGVGEAGRSVARRLRNGGRR